MELEFIFEEHVNHEEENAILQGYRRYSEPYMHGADILSGDFYLYAIEKNSKEVIGGVMGSLGKYMRLRYVWIKDNCRSQGIGRKLLEKIEEFARSKGSRFILLNTYEFQAKPFYEKIGYKCIGTIPKWIEGYDCHFMRKELY
jgi:GNAT superfamily N-acetyltransferase